MLVLSRKKDQQLVIQLGEETVLVRVLGLNGDRVRFGITAPKSVPIHREEVARRLQALPDDLDAPVSDI
jgi:carbon storage regulator